MKKFTPVDAPLNANERYLHGICERLEHLIELLSPPIEEVVEEVKKPVARKRKTVAKEE